MNDLVEKKFDEKYCCECGAAIKTRAEVCPKCGVRQWQSSSSSNDKSRMTAALLAFFLGGVGVHKFYLGQSGAGIVYLIFCWTFIPAIIGFIESIVFLTMSDDQFNKKYG